jgi:uncharacterized protein YyaL (SSP411 family)
VAENRLINESSPYLLQHAHNPVQWCPWGAEALERARSEDKPIFLSVGYSSCHWCHVMAHESFENEEVARIMNESFVNVKVDREERPDIDDIYQKVCQMATGQGGWPLSVFLTPDQRPFYVGTYFPVLDSYGRPGFGSILRQLAQAWKENRSSIVDAAATFTDRLQRVSEPEISKLDRSLLDEAAIGLYRAGDAVYGGFGGAPKFPNAAALSFLFRYSKLSGISKFRELGLRTLKKMAGGGIFDQIGGGFHRYSTDARWLVPHFEKMLYDNALLAKLYLEAYQATGNPFLQRIVRETLAYVMREMTDPEGGFYSTQDADSEGEEGKFFVWDPEEVEALMGVEDAPLFCRYFGVSPEGNFEHGKSILNVSVDLEDLAKFLKVDEQRLADAVERGRKALFEAREKRVKPGRDEKIQVNWNGLMISAFAAAYQTLREPAYLQTAEQAARFILDRMRTGEGYLLHTYKDGRARFTGYQDDYAFLINASVDLYGATFDLAWLKAAQGLAELMVEQFWDDAEGGFFFIGRDHEELIVRSKNPYDNAIPSGNSVGAMALMRLGTILGRKDFCEKAERTLRLFQPFMREMPSGFGQMVCALDFFLQRPVEVVIVGPLQADETQGLLAAVRKRWLPNHVVTLCDLEGDGEALEMIPQLPGKKQVDGRPTAYVCRDLTCSAPVTEISALEALLEDRGRGSGVGGR